MAGRSLASIDNRRFINRRVARQDNIALTTHIDTQSIGTNLPEIVQPLLAPLYALFDFFDLPMELVVEELNRMKANNY